ncbi:MAG: ARPP-1 family domain-containing protein [Bryobacteraceae bacterium]
MGSLKEFVDGLELALATAFQNLVMVPVQMRAEGEPAYLLLREAVEKGLAQVTELGGGTVPEVALDNRADQPVLLVAGEELVGAKQNRMVNLTILAPAQSKIVIPVSCVEAGRWHMVSPRFASADHLVFSRLRAQSTAQVTESLKIRGGRHARQDQVWDSIAERRLAFDVESGTGAVDAIFEQRRVDLEEFAEAIKWEEGQAGAAFLIDGKPAGIDVFDHPETMRKLLPRLVRSYAVDALASQEIHRRQREKSRSGEEDAASAVDAVETIRKWLAGLDDSGAHVSPAVGMGQDFRLESGETTAAALWALERFIHFCAFPHEQRDTGGAEGAFARTVERMRTIQRRMREDLERGGGRGF